MAEVWYAAYGSNCDAARLAVYLRGGVLPETGEDHPGSAQAKPPRDWIPFTFPRALGFAGHSAAWGGAPAVLTTTPGLALGRAWRLSWRQLEDLVAQENGRPHQPLPLPAPRLTVHPDGLYGSLERVGSLQRLPVVTCTTPPERMPPAGAPSGPYLGVIGRGLLATYRLHPGRVAAYLAEASGGTWSADDVRSWLQQDGQTMAQELTDGTWGVGAAGEVDFVAHEDAIDLLAVRPEEGWRYTAKQKRPNQLDVTFKRDDETCELELHARNGVLWAELEAELDDGALEVETTYRVVGPLRGAASQDPDASHDNAPD